jgi:hypothetical protein
MTIGDILAVIALILLTAGAWVATILLAVLFFPARTAQAKERLIAAPGKCAARGLGILLILTILAIAFSGHPGPSRLISLAFWGMLAIAAAAGSGGMVRLLSERIQEDGSVLSPFASLTRASLLYVAAGLLPIIGWFVITPLALVLSIGAAIAPVKKPKEDAVQAIAVSSEKPVGLNWEPL